MTTLGYERAVTSTTDLFRREPAYGEIGSVTSCPLCAPGHPPCLACRDTLRARLLESATLAMGETSWN